MAAGFEEVSSHEESSTGRNKVLRSMRSMLSSIPKTMCQTMNSREEEIENFRNIFNVLTELDNTLKKNTYETHIANVNFSMFEKYLFNRQIELLDIERHFNDKRHKETMEEFSMVKSQMVEIQGCMRRNDNESQEFADSIARKFQAKEDAKANVEGAQPRQVQGESSRRNDGVSTDTRSMRAPSTDDNPRPTKRGGGRSGAEGRGTSGGVRSRLSNVDQGGRTSGDERGGRSCAGGRAVGANVCVNEPVASRAHGPSAETGYAGAPGMSDGDSMLI
ncbi:keratin, type I cytoskeletal 10-like [Impatiens glandulifera]|uniref:keratin, type I cytoskeletal 10-like n=1 Tax=Impatiens glandulifera TaxID=253017 RepID=UPI001FB18992|nr:keratin, type I cytoskeletal 10-like [Impatiens glandulifera]